MTRHDYHAQIAEAVRYRDGLQALLENARPEDVEGLRARVRSAQKAVDYLRRLRDEA